MRCGGMEETGWRRSREKLRLHGIFDEGELAHDHFEGRHVITVGGINFA